jgi:hypothetical protein
MKLTTVLGSVNNNPDYYLFIPKQIKFWKHFNINFFAVFVGDAIPDDLIEFKSNIILWNFTPHLNSVYVSQNIRIFMSALLNLPDDEMVMITDMDMLPCSDTFYKEGLDKLNKDSFVYYRHIDFENKQIFMCYNAANPSTWGKIFGIKNKDDVINKLEENRTPNNFLGIPDTNGWYTDQTILFNNLINYENLIVLNRHPKRLEVITFINLHNKGKENFYLTFDDAHFHRSFFKNKILIEDAEKQLNI